MANILAILVSEDDSFRAGVGRRLFGPGAALVHAGSFKSDEDARAWRQAGGHADIVVRAAAPATRRPTSQPADVEAGGRLTEREREVLILLSKGLTYSEIGTTLGIRLGTVQCHIKRLYSKLDVNTKAEAALAAMALGLV